LGPRARSVAPTRVRDRSTGQIFDERVFGGSALNFLYETRAGRLLTDRVLARELPHWIYGWLQRRPASREKVPEFVRSLGIDASEAERPLDDYRSLDDFFTRRLRPGARVFDSEPTHLCAPAEGRVLVVPEVDGLLSVKASRVGLAELLGDAALARRYAGGAAVIVRLAPADYHRFHFCDGGTAGEPRALVGRLHSVHPIALGAGAPSLRNRRAVTVLDSDRFGSLALVEVGALCVGTIEQSFAPGRVERGQEKGLFRFGGSTVVLLAEPGRVRLDEDLEVASAEGLETLVRVGTRIGVSAS
jgi:phosphatidylserine decarboxylase